MSETGYVYTLDDPRTGEPKYVGATVRPKERLKLHTRSPHSDALREWVADAPALAADVEGHSAAWPLVLRTRKAQGKYGRWLAEIYDAGGTALNDALVDEFGEEVRDA